MAPKKKSSIDVDALRKKISGEATFISGVMNKIPTMSWQEDSDSSGGEDEEDNGVAMKNMKPTQGELSESLKSKVLEGPNLLKGKHKGARKSDISKKSRPERPKKIKSEQKNQKPSKLPVQAKAGFSSEGKMVFSKFDFSEMGSYVEEKKKKVCNDPRRILEKLKERHELIQKLKSEGNEEKALKLKEKDEWNKAFSKVQGIKVRDDPELLRETIYKQDLRKAKHKKLWENRDEKVKKALEYRVIKRETNIKAKRDLKLKHRLKKALKKGRVIPGFS